LADSSPRRRSYRVKYALPMLAVATSALALVAATPAPADEPPAIVVTPDTYQGKTAGWWARRAVQARKDANKRGRTIQRLRRTLAHDTTVYEAFRLAETIYGVDDALLRRKAWCESRFNPRAKNRHSTASGIGQFLDSTWASTPFGRFSVFSPVANILAMGWMHAHGRGDEWACR
jgi:soluble lytic murein transglycosylase-like protein